MSFDQSDVRNLRLALTTSLRTNWKLFLIEGIVLVLLGAAAIIVPPIATLTVTFFIGWLLLFSGIAGLYLSYYADTAGGASVAAVVVGFYVVVRLGAPLTAHRLHRTSVRAS